jgi:hypothetical protein
MVSSKIHNLCYFNHYTLEGFHFYKSSLNEKLLIEELLQASVVAG